MKSKQTVKSHLGNVFCVAIVVDSLLPPQLCRVQTHLVNRVRGLVVWKRLVESGFAAEADDDAVDGEADHPLLRLLDLVALPPVPSLQLKVGHPGGRRQCHQDEMKN